MPVSYRISRKPNYLQISFSGRVTIKECLEKYEEASQAAAFYPTIPTLLKIGAEVSVEPGGIVSEQIERFAEVLTNTRQGRAYRVATAGGDVDTRAFFAMGQSVVNSSAERRTFDTVPAALKWLLHDEA